MDKVFINILKGLMRWACLFFVAAYGTGIKSFNEAEINAYLLLLMFSATLGWWDNG